MDSGGAGVPSPRRRSDFLVTPYLPDAEGVLQPVLPSRCPVCKVDVVPKLSVHLRRSRIFGPTMPLAVLHCHTDGRFYTLYPPGYVPYGRQPLLHVDIDGNALAPAAPEQDPFEDTLLELPVPATEPPRVHDLDNEAVAAVRRSQARAGQRRVGLLGQLFGLGRTVVRVREQISVLLNLPLVLLTLAASAYAEARFAVRRQQVRRVLDALVLGPGLLWRVMEAGYRTGVFGRAWIVWRGPDGRPGGTLLPFPGPEWVG